MLTFSFQLTICVLIGALIKVENATVIYTGENLYCYDCSVSFKLKYIPDTPCERSNLSGVPLARCHTQDKYCKVERTSVKGMTTIISRGCSRECNYGCKVDGFGVTLLKCTSCCRYPKCNTGNNAARLTVSVQTTGMLLFLFRLLTLLLSK